MKRRSVHLRDGQADAISDYRRASVAREDVPEMNEAEVIRELVDAGIENSDLDDLIDEATLAKYRYERYKEREGWLRNMRNGFRAKVADHFKTRFKSGWNPDELEGFAENMKRDAHFWWPGEEHAEARREAIEYVEDVVDAAVEATQVSAVDPLDPDSLFEQFSGVEEGQERRLREEQRETDTFDDLQDEARRRVRRLADQGGSVDTDALADALAKEGGVDVETAYEAVDDATAEVLRGVPR